MGVILDTSVVIGLERGTVTLDAVTKGRESEPFGISVVTVAELLHGVHRAKPAARRIQREAFVEQIIAQFTSYPFDLAAARIYSRLWADLASKGTAVGAHDLLIAATAISIGYEVLTVNERDFRRIPGLSHSKIS